MLVEIFGTTAHLGKFNQYPYSDHIIPLYIKGT